MRKFLKFLLWTLASLITLALALSATVYIGSNVRLYRSYRITPATVSIPSDETAIEHGRHIAQTRGCIDCHGADLGGAKVVDDPAIGHLHGPNLTRGQGGVPASFRDEDWVRAIRHGVSTEGRPLFLMPSQEFAHMSDAELGELIAYLKSVSPVDRARGPVSVGPVGRALVLAGKMPIAAEVIDHANLQPATIKPGRTLEYGRYLAAGCIGCHGPNYSGGKIAAGPPDWPPAANLTPHPKSAVASWTEADFLRTLHTGRRPNGTELNPVMPRNFGLMNDDELGALWLFLQSLPAAPTGAR